MPRGAFSETNLKLLSIYISLKRNRQVCNQKTTLSSLFVLLSQLSQDLLIAGLPAGDSVKISAGIFADRHTLGSKCPADVAEVTLMLSRIKFVFSLHSLLGNQSSHINNPSNNLNVRLCVRSQVTRKLVLSQYQVGFKWRTTTQKLLNIFQILVRCYSYALLRSICIFPAVLQYPTQLHLIIAPAKWMLNIIL